MKEGKYQPTSENRTGEDELLKREYYFKEFGIERDGVESEAKKKLLHCYLLANEIAMTLTDALVGDGLEIDAVALGAQVEKFKAGLLDLRNSRDLFAIFALITRAVRFFAEYQSSKKISNLRGRDKDRILKDIAELQSDFLLFAEGIAATLMTLKGGSDGSKKTSS